jgi:hypothetical protein
VQHAPAPGWRHSSPERALDVVVISHTHWDREWYRLAGRFRQRLVRLVDELLAREAPPFLLDGQAIVVEDYLAVRPERREMIARALRDGRLEAGPWYVLADELIPAGESLVRNLLAGRRVLQSLGATPPAVLYSPDAFGHPAALPQLADGFGLPLVIAWRGYGGRRWPAGDTVWWSAASGARVLLHHLAPSGYELGSSLPTDAAGAAARWRALRAVLAPRATLGLALLPNGADHHALQDDAEDALAALAVAADGEARVRRGTLAGFARELGGRAEGAELPCIAGELRDSYGYTWTLQGTFGTRAAQKRGMRLVERRLLREAEPWAALAMLAGGEDPRAPLHAAWRTLLACHPHDTLCGCSADGVALAMDARLADARAQVDGLRDDALDALVGHDADAARARREEWRPALLLRNPAARPRGGVVEVELLQTLADEPVGPGSSATRVPAVPPAPEAGGLPFQVLERRVRRDRLEAARHYPDNDLVAATRAVVWAPEVPGYGTYAVALRAAGEARGAPPEHHDTPAAPRDPHRSAAAPTIATHPGPTAPVRASDHALDNGLLRVAVDDAGLIRLEAPGHGRVIPDLLGFEDVGDLGDLYTASPAGEPRSDARFLGARLLHAGPLRGELRLRWRLDVPARWMPRDGTAARSAARPRGRVALPLEVRIVLDADSPFLRLAVRGVNGARDHRLRLRVATGLVAARTRADAAFGPLWREPLAVDDADRAMESPPPTAPLQRYVSRYAEDLGVTLFADGLAEYESRDDGAILVTLLRAVGQLSRADLPERPGHAGWPADTPGAQSQGPFRAHFAILPHGGPSDAMDARLDRMADDALCPPVGTTRRGALRLPAPAPGLELDGEGLAFSTCKPAEDGAGTIVRCVNLTGTVRGGRWLFGAPVGGAWLSRMDETPLQPLTVSGRTVSFEAPPHGTITIRVAPGRGAEAE